jgi:hypothetical protein
VAKLTADELKQTLANSGFVYDPKPTSTRVDESGSPIGQRYYVDDSGAIREVTEPKFLFRHLLSGEHFTADEIVNYLSTERLNQTGRSRQQLVQDIEGMASQSAASPFGPNTLNLTEGQQAQLLSTHTEYQKAYDASRNRGGFGGFLGDLVGGINEVVTAITDPVANALGVHPDVVKVAAAALGMYYAPGVGAADAAGATISEAAAAEMIAASGVEALAAAGNMEAAAALAAGAESLAVPSMLPGATAFPVATSPLATMGAATPLTAADIAALGAESLAVPATNALAPAFLPPTNAIIDAVAAPTGSLYSPLMSTNALTAADFAALDAGLGGVPAFTPPTNAAMAALPTPAGSLYNPLMSTSALSAADLAAISGAEGLAAPATLGGPGAGAGLGAGVVDSLANVVSPGGGIDASIGQAYSNLGVGSGLGLGTAANTLANVVSPGEGIDTSIGKAYSDLGVGSGLGLGTAANALTNVVSPGEGIDTSVGKAYADLGVGTTGLPTDLFSSLAKLAKDYGVPLSALVSAVTGSQAATNAAEIQAQSAREARALAEKMFNEQKALQEPYRSAGITAQNQLLNLLGLSGNTAAAEYGKFARPFGMSDFQADPGYAFRLSEGMKALEASRAAKGGLLSGATGKALQRYGQEMGTQEYGNAFNRYQTERANRLNPLAGLMASGQAAAAGQAANAGNYATTAGNLTTDIGAAQAAGGIGSANAITNAMNQLARYSAGQNIADQIRQSVYAPVIR